MNPNNRSLLRRSVWAVACAGLLLLSPSLRAAKITLETRTVALPDGSTVEYELGTLHVPENRNDPASRTIGVGFARFRALAPTGAPPTFHLPGGPGGSYVRGLTLTKADPAARKLSERQAADLKLYRQIGDVIYVDQRGCSDLGEDLVYAYDIPAKPLNQPGSMARETAEMVEASKAAVADNAKKGIDLRGYTVIECAADVNDVRRELGYERITLIGQSFGSQWSFAIMRLHPDIVARAVLSGVEPLDCGYDMPSHIYASMRRQWQAVEREAAFKPYLPAGGIAGAVSEIARRLERDRSRSIRRTNPARPSPSPSGATTGSQATPPRSWRCITVTMKRGPKALSRNGRRARGGSIR